MRIETSIPKQNCLASRRGETSVSRTTHIQNLYQLWLAKEIEKFGSFLNVKMSDRMLMKAAET